MRGFIAILLVAGAAPAARAQEVDECVAWSVASLPALVERFALTPEQEAWFRDALARPRDTAADAVADLPGAGAELREALEAAFCDEGGPRTVALSSAARWGPREPVREQRASVESDRVTVMLRRRDDATRGTLRGGAAVRGRGWRVLGGDLALRSRLALLAGADARASAVTPAPPRETSWRATTRLDDTTPRGIAVEVAGRGTTARAMRSTSGAAATLVEVERRLDTAAISGAVLDGEGRRAGALGVRIDGASGAWGAEWARAEATAWSLAWTRASGRWRFGASAGGRSRGYLAGLGDGEVAPPSGESFWRGEARVRPAAGRFLRAAAGFDRDADRDGWGRIATTVEVEGGERVGPGLDVTLLWRRRERAALAGVREPALSVVRGDLERARRGWRFLVRAELRDAGGERARLVAIRVGRTRSPRWEVRGALVDRSTGAPEIWWYRRRAGGLYGWDELSAGAWVGGWGRIDAGALRIEASADARSRGVDLGLSLALRHTLS